MQPITSHVSVFVITFNSIVFLSSSLLVLGCSSQRSGAVEKRLTEAVSQLETTQKQLAATQAKLAKAVDELASTAQPARPAQPAPDTPHAGTPRGDAHEWPRCKARSHDSKRRRISLEKLSAKYKGALMGIDVSHYDGRPDWSEVAASGVTFAYAKATQGTGFHDQCFERNAEGASASGLLWGAYHVLDPKADPEKQAEWFLKVVGDREYSLPLVLDIEAHLMEGHPVADIRDRISKWLAYVEKQTKRKPMLYVGHNLMKSYFKGKWYFGDHKVWFADYNYRSHPDYLESMPAWSIWQFSDKGQVPSIRSALDMDLFRGTRKQLASLVNN